MRHLRSVQSTGRAVAALLIACALLALEPAATAAAQDQKTIRIMVARSISAVPMLAIGPFAEKYGLKTEILPFATNGEMQNGLRSGSAQLGQLGQQSPAILADQGATDVKVIFGYASGAHNLIVRKAAGIKSWKDLEGKTIGRAPGTFTGILFTLAAQENNVDLSKVNLVNTTAVGTAELQALKSGDLDGLAMYSPIIDRAVVEGYAEYPPCCNILTTKKFGRGNRDLRRHHQLSGRSGDGGQIAEGLPRFRGVLPEKPGEGARGHRAVHGRPASGSDRSQQALRVGSPRRFTGGRQRCKGRSGVRLHQDRHQRQGAEPVRFKLPVRGDWKAD